MAFNSGKGIPTTWKKTSVSKYAKWDFGNLKRKEKMIKKIFDFWLPKSNYLNFEVAWFMISLKFLVSHKMAPLCLNAEFCQKSVLTKTTDSPRIDQDIFLQIILFDYDYCT